MNDTRRARDRREPATGEPGGEATRPKESAETETRHEESTQASAPPRFFFDHGKLHDRETGQHLHTEADMMEACSDAASNARDEMRATDPWRRALDDKLVNIGLDCLGPGETPQQAIKRLIEWETTTALDPAVSEQAQALIEQGRASAPQVVEPTWQPVSETDLAAAEAHLAKASHGAAFGFVPADAHWLANITAHMIREVRATRASAPSVQVPDGWKLVPLEPTLEMRKACDNGPGAMVLTNSEIYRAMLSAAPAASPLQLVAHVDHAGTATIRWQEGLTLGHLPDGAPLFMGAAPAGQQGS